MLMLCYLSKEESFGFPLIEAMYLGLPIVCPDLPLQEPCVEMMQFILTQMISSH